MIVFNSFNSCFQCTFESLIMSNTSDYWSWSGQITVRKSAGAEIVPLSYNNKFVDFISLLCTTVLCPWLTCFVYQKGREAVNLPHWSHHTLATIALTVLTFQCCSLKIMAKQREDNLVQNCNSLFCFSISKICFYFCCKYPDMVRNTSGEHKRKYY